MWIVVILVALLAGRAEAQEATATVTETATITATPAATATPTRTPALRDEWVTTHRFQRTCGTTGSIAAGAVAEVCLTWPAPSEPDGLGAAETDLETWCAVADTPTASAATLQVHHQTTDSPTQACAVVFNRDATNARTGTLCCWGYRWATTQPTPTPG